VKLLSENSNFRVYLETIDRTPYTIKISTSGELLGIEKYDCDKSSVAVSQRLNNVEFG